MNRGGRPPSTSAMSQLVRLRARATGTVRSMTHTFNVVFEDAGDGWVYAHVPELPEVQTQGENLDDARSMVKDAIALALDERSVRGESIPPKGWALVESVEIAA